MTHPHSAPCSSATTVIFDADDTLWETQPLYTKAKEEFCKEMHRVGFPRDEVQKRFESIDHANVLKFGFSKQRFPQSMRDTYQVLCSAYTRTFDRAMALRVISIGEAVFEESPNIFPGVDEVLSELRAYHVRLLLATKGDEDVQMQRVKSSRLHPYFDRVVILAEKGVKEFQWIVAEEAIDVSRGWSVGNSTRSDIKPALAVGLHAILIPYKTWIYEDDELPVDPHFHKVESLTEVPRIILGAE